MTLAGLAILSADSLKRKKIRITIIFPKWQTSRQRMFTLLCWESKNTCKYVQDYSVKCDFIEAVCYTEHYCCISLEYITAVQHGIRAVMKWK